MTEIVAGQRIKTPVATQEYRDNWDVIFGSKEIKEVSKKDTETV